jgi:hypothetical protein
MRRLPLSCGFLKQRHSGEPDRIDESWRSIDSVHGALPDQGRRSRGPRARTHQPTPGILVKTQTDMTRRSLRPVIDRASLIANKRALGHLTDLEDVKGLEE